MRPVRQTGEGREPRRHAAGRAPMAPRRSTPQRNGRSDAQAADAAGVVDAFAGSVSRLDRGATRLARRDRVDGDSAASRMLSAIALGLVRALASPASALIAVAHVGDDPWSDGGFPGPGGAGQVDEQDRRSATLAKGFTALGTIPIVSDARPSPEGARSLLGIHAHPTVPEPAALALAGCALAAASLRRRRAGTERGRSYFNRPRGALLPVPRAPRSLTRRWARRGPAGSVKKRLRSTRLGRRPG